MNELTTGTGKLQDGMNQLTDGSEELASKLKEGAEKASDVKANEDVYNMFAEPVKVKNEKMNKSAKLRNGIYAIFLIIRIVCWRSFTFNRLSTSRASCSTALTI